MSDMAPHSRVTQAPDILSTDVGGEMVLMNPARGEYYTLDAIAADIWQRLQGGIAVADLVRTLTADYAAEPDVVEADTMGLLASFAEKGLIELDHTPI